MLFWPQLAEHAIQACMTPSAVQPLDTPTLLQVVEQILGIHVAFDGNIGHVYQHRPRLE